MDEIAELAPPTTLAAASESSEKWFMAIYISNISLKDSRSALKRCADLLLALAIAASEKVAGRPLRIMPLRRATLRVKAGEQAIGIDAGQLRSRA